MISENKWIQYGFPRTEEDIQGITLHETGNVEMNAEQLFNWLNEENKSSQGCHYLVDDTQTIQVMPDDWAVYHTGKGKDFGCRYTIAIEICSSLSDEKYKMAEDRAISLIYALQKKYHIPMDMIFFHRDFNETTYCPKTILNNYGTSKNFVYNRLEEL
jgi:N-acetylmuramoyl-L-alanine amidase CwlA